MLGELAHASAECTRALWCVAEPPLALVAKGNQGLIASSVPLLCLCSTPFLFRTLELLTGRPELGKEGMGRWGSLLRDGQIAAVLRLSFPL